MVEGAGEVQGGGVPPSKPTAPSEPPPFSKEAAGVITIIAQLTQALLRRSKEKEKETKGPPSLENRVTMGQVKNEGSVNGEKND